MTGTLRELHCAVSHRPRLVTDAVAAATQVVVGLPSVVYGVVVPLGPEVRKQ